MSTTAKVFKNGRSQAIRMPREFRVTGSEVHLRRVPEGILIVERDPWDECLDACRELSADVLSPREKRAQGPAQRRNWWWEEPGVRKSRARKAK